MAESIKPGSVKSVAVVGGGVSGLAAAYKLKSQGINVTVFEAEEKAGGKLRSVSRDGLIWDEGANKMTESSMEVKGLLDNFGLRETLQFPISQNKRYVVKDGAPTLIPSNPIALIASSLLSTKSKFQIFFEPLLWRSPAHRSNQSKMSTEYSQESVREFFQRHFGEEVVEYLVDPFVAGTSAGDADSLSRLTDMLSKDLGDDLKLKSKVLSLSYNGDDISSSNNWSLSYATNQKTGEPSAHQSFDAVIMTAPLCNVKEMKIKTCGGPFILDFIPKITYLPLSVVITAYRKQNVKRPLEGFGVLVPTKEQQNGLKTLAPNDMYLYTTFVGGSRNPELAKASLDELKHVVTSDLGKLLGAEGEPAFVNHFYWSKAFPLYGHGYNLVIEAIEKMEGSLPGFFCAGYHRAGVSVGKAISSGCEAADLVISHLNKNLVREEKLR